MDGSGRDVVEREAWEFVKVRASSAWSTGPALHQRANEYDEDILPREAFGVREACFRFRMLSKAEASFTHSKRFARFVESNMKTAIFHPTAALLALVLAALGCHKKPSIKSEVTELEKAFPAAASAAAPAPIQQPAAAQPASQADPNAYVNLALSAVRSNDYAGGIIALQTVQRMQGVTAAQMMAAERAKQAMTAELVSRAAGGDPTAQAALSAIEKTRSQ